MELRGVAASPGIALGTVLRVDPSTPDYSHVTPGTVPEETARLEKALEELTARTRALAQQAGERAGEEQARILEGQLAMLADPYLQSRLREELEGGKSAEGAADTVLQSFMDLFAQSGDELMAQRAADVGDLRDRLLSLLLGRELPDLTRLPPGTVLVVKELTPSMTAGLDLEHLEGVVAELGGYTSHAAILARAMELPAVLGVTGALEALRDGEPVAADGGAGLVLPSPDPATLEQYRHLQGAEKARRAALEAFRGRPTVTADGRAVKLCANAGSLREARLARENSGEGIGLFRTEFLFLERAQAPDEEEQYRFYKEAAELFPRGEVILRTLDIGGDKPAPFLDLPREDNPFLGHRAIRLCLDRPELFLTQLRALLRAAAHGPVRIMLPLVTRLAELRQAKKLLEEARAALTREGVETGEAPLGVMIETPAAALMADELAREAAFFSIGTNDLTQYTLCADRGNGAVSAIGSPFDPAVLRLIRHVIAAGHRGGIPVGMCGEACADPRLIPLLLSFGLDEFSVGPASLLSTRREIARWTKAEADAVAQTAMALDTEEAVRACLEQAAAEK